MESLEDKLMEIFSSKYNLIDLKEEYTSYKPILLDYIRYKKWEHFYLFSVIIL